MSRQSHPNKSIIFFIHKPSFHDVGRSPWARPAHGDSSFDIGRSYVIMRLEPGFIKFPFFPGQMLTSSSKDPDQTWSGSFLYLSISKRSDIYSRTFFLPSSFSFEKLSIKRISSCGLGFGLGKCLWPAPENNS